MYRTEPLLNMPVLLTSSTMMSNVQTGLCDTWTHGLRHNEMRGKWEVSVDACLYCLSCEYGACLREERDAIGASRQMEKHGGYHHHLVNSRCLMQHIITMRCITGYINNAW